MTIKLKINNSQTFAIEEIMTMVDNYETISQSGKAIKSILYEVQDKFLNLAKKVKRSKDVFNVKKKYALTLKYHEAFALYEYGKHMTIPSKHPADAFDKKTFDIRNVIIQLEPKLL